MHTYEIWYMKPEWFPNGIFGEKPNPERLEQTHIHLMDLKINGSNLEDIYMSMQGEKWSPNGEARDLIEEKGLRHTSMSVGDVIKSSNGICYLVASFGFQPI